MKKRFWALFLSLVLVLSLFPASVFAADKWWEEDAWDLETLTMLGAEAPAWNASEKVYEISKPEQLLFMTGYWKLDDNNGDGVADAPADGNYALVADLDMAPLMDRIKAAIAKAGGSVEYGYMPPIGAFCDSTAPAADSAFFGRFDGGFHSISNLNIVRMGDKYCGLFGNIGHDFGEGFVKNLALLNMFVHAKASCGLLAGAVYGEVENIVVTGSILCEEKTAGGLAGKVKKNDNGYVGVARNCFVDCDILLNGQGSENGAVGGITSANSNGGALYNCYAAGSIKVYDTGADCVAGISGNLKKGNALEGCVMLLSDIFTEDGTNVGLLCGSFSGESGSHLKNNFAYEGTRLAGNVSSDHPLSASFEKVGLDRILSKSLYSDGAGWDFDTVWTWIGDENEGFPMIRGFENVLPADYVNELKASLALTEPVLSMPEPTVNTAYEGEAAEIVAELLLPEGFAAEGAKLVYGKEKDAAKLSDSVEMTACDGGFTVAFPETKIAKYYYYVSATVNGEELRYPTKGTLLLNVVSASEKYAPKFITVSPGTDPTRVGLNWITEVSGLSSEIRYRVAGTNDWTILPVTEIEQYAVGGADGITSFSVDLENLTPDTGYEYQAVTSDGSKSYLAEVNSFTTLPAGKDFSFIVISDLQATNEEGYMPFKYTMEGFLKENPVDFIINVGDMTEDNTMSQWSYMFSTIGDILGSKLTAYAPGNHENSGDQLYYLFKGGTNLPGGIDDPYLAETTSAFIVGDVCIITLNTEPYNGIAGTNAEADKRAFYEAEKAWAKDVFEQSGCKWRILCSHAGLIQDDEIATAFLEQMCDELNVDLYFNGHIHNYYRASVLNGAHAELGAGTTFITTSPMGCKFDPYEGEIDDILDFQTGGKEDARQYFTRVTASENELKIEAFQRTEAGDATAKNCKDYTVIDSITLTKVENDNLKPEAPETKGLSVPAIIGICAGAAAVAAAVCVLVIKKKKTK